MSTYPERIRAEGIFPKGKELPNGGTAMKVSIKLDKFIDWANQHVDENGWLKLDFFPMKTPTEKGITHYANLDTWKPDPNRSKSVPPPESNRRATRRDDDEVPY